MRPSLDRTPLGGVAARAGTALRAAAFWVAVALPFVVVALLAVDGTGSLRHVALLLACNAVALVVGHGYRAGGRRSTDRDR